MKKSIKTKTIIALAITLCTINSYAQSFYVKVNAGYNWGIASNVSTTNQTQTGSTISYENVNQSYGKGISFCGTAGYMFNKNIGAELGVNYLVGGTNERSLKSSSNGTDDKFTSTSTLLNFIPTLVFSTSNDKINPYAKIGFSLGMATWTVKVDQVNTFGSTTQATSQTIVSKGGVALGLVSALGIAYKMNDKISLFGELNISTLSYSPTKGEVTESKLNGFDNLSDLTYRDKNVEYVDSYTNDRSFPPNENVAEKTSKVNLPFSSLGLNIGVKYSF